MAPTLSEFLSIHDDDDVKRLKRVVENAIDSVAPPFRSGLEQAINDKITEYMEADLLSSTMLRGRVVTDMESALPYLTMDVVARVRKQGNHLDKGRGDDFAPSAPRRMRTRAASRAAIATAPTTALAPALSPAFALVSAPRRSRVGALSPVFAALAPTPAVALAPAPAPASTHAPLTATPLAPAPAHAPALALSPAPTQMHAPHGAMPLPSTPPCASPAAASNAFISLGPAFSPETAARLGELVGDVDLDDVQSSSAAIAPSNEAPSRVLSPNQPRSEAPSPSQMLSPKSTRVRGLVLENYVIDKRAKSRHTAKTMMPTVGVEALREVDVTNTKRFNSTMRKAFAKEIADGDVRETNCKCIHGWKGFGSPSRGE